MISKRYINVAAKECPEHWELLVWEPFRGNHGVLRCTAYEAARAVVEEFMGGLLGLRPEEMVVTVYKLRGTDW